MKFIVVSCIERDIQLEAVCKTYDEALKVMTEKFVNFHIDFDFKINIKHEIESVLDGQESDCGGCYCGFYKDSIGCTGWAWSNEDDDYSFDIKIFQVK